MSGEMGLRAAAVITDPARLELLHRTTGGAPDALGIEIVDSLDASALADADLVFVDYAAPGIEGARSLRARGYAGTIVLLPDAASGAPALKRITEELMAAQRAIAIGAAVSKARHDANNPLTALLAEAQLLEMEPLPPDQREAVGRIVELTRRVAAIIRGMGK